MLRLALGVVLSFVSSAWSQTVTDVPVEQGPGVGGQSGAGSVAGQGSSKVSPSTTLRSPAMRSTLPGGVNAPKVQAKTGSGAAVAGSPVVGAAVDPGIGLAAPAVEQRETPANIDLKSDLVRPEMQNQKTDRPSASSTLGTAVRQVQSSGIQEAAGSGGFAVNETLRQVFDTARKASGAPGSPRVMVTGKLQDAQEKISQTVSVANGASPHDAPGLYQAAIAAAKESFVPGFARDVSRAVLDSADKKAETSLPQLAQEAYSAAYAGEAAAVAKAFKSFGLWDKLLGSGGKPLVENMSHLKADVERVLNEKAAGKALAAVASASGQGAAKVWFARAAGGSSFMAMLPATSVSPLPKELAASFALRETETRTIGEDSLIALFRRDPSAANGARLIFQANREAGVSSFGSFFEAAVYWLKAAFAGLWRAVFGHAAAPAARLGSDHEAAMALMYSRGADWDLGSARALIARGKAMAGRYKASTGDDSAEQALSSLEARLDADAAKLGVEERDPLPPVLARLVSGDGATVSHWIERMHDTAPVLSASSPLLDPGEKLLLQSRAAVPRLLADAKRRGPWAAKIAAAIRSLDPSPLRFATIGRAGDYLVQSAGRKTKDGRLMVFTVMREQEFGQLAYARAEWAGLPSMSVSPRDIAAP